MTEAEWEACADPNKMLEFLRGKASDRKLRLFFCACCRSKRYTVCPQGIAAVAVAEAFADGLADETVRVDVERLIQSHLPEEGNWSEYSLIAWALHRETGGSYPLDYVMMWAIPSVIQADLACNDEITSVLRDICGNPFRAISLDPAWLTWHGGLLVPMAHKMYDSRDFRDMPVLADALEEAGCTDPDVLNHCRQPGEHVRGCWLIDALLGKT